ncbi:restriction endonuclease subunit S [Comamonas composti]|uniref:restriction endonuclease subunit S n=1 Tax=Comamonas composti TaxID=408558 RepID=UPI0004013F45|nr:restriction endonuclease subunit S [Comamonas composti]
MSALPCGWATAAIADVATFNPKTLAEDSLNAAFAPMQYLGTRYRHRMAFEQKPWGEIKKAYVHFQPRDVIVAKVTPCFENGKAGVAPPLPNNIGAGSSEFCVFRPFQGIDGRYLLAWLSTEDFRRRATVAMTGSVGLKRVPKEVFLTEEIPLAPKQEQRRIADKLDTVLAHVDAVNERLARVAPLLKRLRQSVLAAATSGRLTEDWREGAPDWKILRADEICEKVQSGGTPKAGFSENGVPFLKVYNIVDQKVDFHYRPQYVADVVNSSELRKSQVKPGDVLMNIVGPPLGKVAIVPSTYDAWNINQAITLFRPSEAISAQWIYAVLCEGAPIRAVLSSTKGSVGQVNISLSQCRAFDFPVPSTEEQTEIVRRVELLFAYADRLEARLQSAQTAANRLTPALLAKAFRGELVPQDPDDEPAAELLRRLAESRSSLAAKPRKPRNTAYKNTQNPAPQSAQEKPL